MFPFIRTSFNPLKQPQSLGLLKDQLPEEYRKLTIFSNNGKHHIKNLDTGIHSNKNAVYTIDIKTGDRENAGTDSTISIRFSGEEKLVTIFLLLQVSCKS